MKVTTLLIASFVSCTAFAQSFTGTWNGELKVQNMKLKVVFHLKSENDKWSGTMDSPDQGAKNIPIQKVQVKKDSVFISDSRISMNYKGKLVNDQILGKFEQGIFITNLDLNKGEVKPPNRPQTPVAPFAYKAEDLEIKNLKDNVTLAGTLTLPNQTKKAPLLVLISGSGAQDRDETLFNHKPFAVIADFFTKNGYAVFRFDDRGTAKSSGNFLEATSFDFANDVDAIVTELAKRTDINAKKIGLIGHSEGGIVAGITAAKNKKVSYIISLAGPGVSGKDILELQSYLIGKEMGLPEEQLQQAKKSNLMLYDFIMAENWTDFNTSANNVIDKYKLEQPEIAKFKNEELMDQIVPKNAKWFKTFLETDPKEFYQQLKIPVLALNGEKDIQVSADQNITALQTVFKNKKSASKVYPNLNHLFQNAKTGATSEYGEIEETFSEQVLHDILNWLNRFN